MLFSKNSILRKKPLTLLVAMVTRSFGALTASPCDGGIEAMARAQRSRKIPCIENTKLKRRRREREGEGIKEGKY